MASRVEVGVAASIRARRCTARAARRCAIRGRRRRRDPPPTPARPSSRSGLRPVRGRRPPLPSNRRPRRRASSVAQLQPVVDTADVGSRAFVHGDDSVRGGQIEGGHAGVAPAAPASSRLRAAARTTVVRVGGQRPLRVEADRRRKPRREASQRRGRHSRMDVDTGKVCGPVADYRVEVGGARRRHIRPPRLVPAVAPDRPVRIATARIRRRARRQCRAEVAARRSRPASVKPGRGEMHVAVDERRRDEAAVEIDDVGVGELRAADVVAAQPRDGACRGLPSRWRPAWPGCGSGRRSEASSTQSGLRGNAGRSTSAVPTSSPGTSSLATSTTSITSPSM